MVYDLTERSTFQEVAKSREQIKRAKDKGNAGLDVKGLIQRRQGTDGVAGQQV